MYYHFLATFLCSSFMFVFIEQGPCLTPIEHSTPCADNGLSYARRAMQLTPLRAPANLVTAPSWPTVCRGPPLSPGPMTALQSYPFHLLLQSHSTFYPLHKQRPVLRPSRDAAHPTTRAGNRLPCWLGANSLPSSAGKRRPNDSSPELPLQLCTPFPLTI